jgi:hypothetical protein
MTKTRLDPAAVHRYLEGWKAFHEFELEELRSTPADVKLRQLDALRGLFDRPDQRSMLEQEDQAARERWTRLREALRA